MISGIIINRIRESRGKQFQEIAEIFCKYITIFITERRLDRIKRWNCDNMSICLCVPSRKETSINLIPEGSPKLRRTQHLCACLSCLKVPNTHQIQSMLRLALTTQTVFQYSFMNQRVATAITNFSRNPSFLSHWSSTNLICLTFLECSLLQKLAFA